MYHFIRILIHRPAIGSSLGPKAASSVVAVASSSKHIIQIVQLLEERRMSFSFCLNKNELLISCGFGLLFQGVDLNPRGKLIQDSRRLICSVVKMLERNRSPSAGHFKEVASAILSSERSPKTSGLPTLETEFPQTSEGCMPAPPTLTKSTRKQFQAIACRLSSENGYGAMSNDKRNDPAFKNGSDVANPGLYSRSNGQNSISPAVSDTTMPHRYSEAVNHVTSSCHAGPSNGPCIDYLSFNNSYPASQLVEGLSEKLFIKNEPDRLIGYGRMQQPQFPYDGHGSSEPFSAYVSPSPSSGPHDSLPDMWKFYSDLNNGSAPTQSVVSFSEDEGTSGEELSGGDLGGKIGGIMMPSANGFCAPNRFGL